MSLIDRVVLFSQHGDIVERAVDPATGKRFPTPSVGVKILAWFARTSWAKRQFLKWITAGAAAISAWLLAHGGSEEQSVAITAGAVAAFTFIYEQGISWLCHKAKISLPDSLLPDDDDDGENDAEAPTRSLGAAGAFSPFAPVRPSIFTAQGISPALHAMNPMTQPTPQEEPATTVVAIKPRMHGAPPRTRLAPLGLKGVKVIAEKTPDDAPTELVRGTLRAEADDGALVILATDAGVRTLERNEWNFYIHAE